MHIESIMSFAMLAGSRPLLSSFGRTCISMVTVTTLIGGGSWIV